jgi:hypothetical protein
MVRSVSNRCLKEFFWNLSLKNSEYFEGRGLFLQRSGDLLRGRFWKRPLIDQPMTRRM